MKGYGFVIITLLFLYGCVDSRSDTSADEAFQKAVQRRKELVAQQQLPDSSQAIGEAESEQAENEPEMNEQKSSNISAKFPAIPPIK